MTNQFELKGEWFLPSNKNRRVHGTLSFHSKEGAKLQLYGGLDSDRFSQDFKDEEIILGLTSESEQVVLHGCFMTKSGGPAFGQGEEYGKPYFIYLIRYTLIGLHVQNADELKFDRISCEIFNLDEWIGISGFINQTPDLEKLKRYEVTVEYKLPEPIDFAIDKDTSGKINFIANQPGFSAYQKSISINQEVELQINSTIEKSVDDLRSYVVGFQNFLILALYRSTYTTSIELSGERYKKDYYGDGKPVRAKIKLYISDSSSKGGEIPKFDMEMLFNYKRIRKEFNLIIRNWYEKYELLEPAFDLVFEQFYNGNKFTVNTFLNLAQSAETFHARIHNHSKVPKEEYELMKDEILKLSPTKYHDWLIDQFKFGNNLNLHARLAEITTKYSNDILDKIIGDKDIFVKQVKHSRNYYTHYSTNCMDKALKGSDLFYLSEKLKILLVCSFLMEIGFTKGELTKFLDNVKYTLFNHLYTWRDEQ